MKLKREPYPDRIQMTDVAHLLSTPSPERTVRMTFLMYISFFVDVGQFQNNKNR